MKPITSTFGRGIASAVLSDFSLKQLSYYRRSGTEQHERWNLLQLLGSLERLQVATETLSLESRLGKKVRVQTVSLSRAEFVPVLVE